MALVGTLVFCRDCGGLLERCGPSQGWIQCTDCGKNNENKWPTSTTTTSAAHAFPSQLRDKRSVIQTLNPEDRQTWAVISQPCPKCENPEMRFRDIQLRSADEGSTIFYACPSCDHKFNTNN